MSPMLEAVHGLGRARRAVCCPPLPPALWPSTAGRGVATVGPPPRRGSSAVDVQQQTGGAETTTHRHREMGVNTHTYTHKGRETGARQCHVSYNTQMSSRVIFKIRAQILCSKVQVVFSIVSFLSNSSEHWLQLHFMKYLRLNNIFLEYNIRSYLSGLYLIHIFDVGILPQIFTKSPEVHKWALNRRVLSCKSQINFQTLHFPNTTHFNLKGI